MNWKRFQITYADTSSAKILTIEEVEIIKGQQASANMLTAEEIQIIRGKVMWKSMPLGAGIGAVSAGRR